MIWWQQHVNDLADNFDNSNQTMGSANSQEKTSWIDDRYSFIDYMQMNEYGRVKVFKKKQQNYDYMGLLKRAVRKDYLKQIQRQLCFLTGKAISLPFLKIFQVIVGELNLHDSLLTSQHQPKSLCQELQTNASIGIYMELLIYTLQEHIDFKKQAKQQITLKQYSYILKTVLAASQLYQEWRLDYLQLNLTSDIIFLKPNGEIKLLPFKSRYLMEEENTCEYTPEGCKPICQAKGEYRTYSFSSPKKKEGKYLKQLKNLSLQLFSTINPNVDTYVRTIPNFNRNILLSLEQLEALKELQFAIVNSRSLREVYESLQDIEDDFLQIQREDGNAEVEINNPEAYQAFIEHLGTLNSFQKHKQSPPSSKHQHVSRNIFEVEPHVDSDTHTNSNLSPRSHQRASFKQCLEKQPSIIILPDLAHPRPYYQ